MPKRIQRSRAKGWKKPEGAVYVGRPTKWGNPFTAKGYWDAGYSGSEAVALQHCVDGFRALLLGKDHWSHGIPKQTYPDPSELRGKDLMCWCPLGQPCHADVLLEIANASDKQGGGVG